MTRESIALLLVATSLLASCSQGGKVEHVKAAAAHHHDDDAHAEDTGSDCTDEHDETKAALHGDEEGTSSDDCKNKASGSGSASASGSHVVGEHHD